ncbi:MAG: MFS transporter [Chloroflexi bacterium]|nr:MFS transporter [Chloroflexota bacterium]
MATYVLEKARSVHYAWVVVVAVFLATAIAAGARSTFGVYVKPLEEEFQATRGIITLIASTSILFSGGSQPLIGHALDRYGPRIVAVVALLIISVGVIVSSIVTELWQLYISFGVVVSLASSATGTVMATVVTSRWFVKHRGLALGLLTSGRSAGQLLLIPLAMAFYLAFGWRMSFLLIGLVVAALMLPIGLLIRNDPGDIGRQAYGGGKADAGSLGGKGADQALKTSLAKAVRTRGFWMLALGFFVCGYSSGGMIQTHLVAYAVGQGFAEMTAATALGIQAATSIPGAVAVGVITDRLGGRRPLTTLYFVRGLALVFLLFVDDPLKLYAFAIIFGLSHSAGVPTATLTAHLFGRLSVGTIFGVIFMSHQIGGATAAYVTGLIFDLTGNYLYGFVIGIVLCFVASGMAASIRTRPATRPAVTPLSG